ncbi:MAG: hypothetical protein WC728_18575 [Elusimicrobiota bacterium]
MGSLIKSIFETGIIEKLISKLVGTKVRIGSAQIDLLSGRLRFTDIVVSNPKGFHAPYILRFRRCQAKIDPLSVLSGKVVVRKMRIRDAEAIYEASWGESNFSAILKNIDRIMGAKPSRGRRAPDKVRYQIDDLVIQGSRIHLSAKLLPGKGLTLPVPAISLEGLGKESPGLSGLEVMAVIIRHVIGEGLKAILPGFGGS